MTNEFMDVSRIIETLRDMGYPVVKDTTVRETDELSGLEQDTVVDLTVVLPDEEGGDEDVREVVRDELSRCVGQGPAGGAL